MKDRIASPLIDLQSITKNYRAKVNSHGVLGKLKDLFNPKYTSHNVLNDISFKLYEAHSLAILGPNGAGKSTLIKILAGIQQPDLGKVTVLNMDDNYSWLVQALKYSKFFIYVSLCFKFRIFT